MGKQINNLDLRDPRMIQWSQDSKALDAMWNWPRAPRFSYPKPESVLVRFTVNTARFHKALDNVLLQIKQLNVRMSSDRK